MKMCLDATLTMSLPEINKLLTIFLLILINFTIFKIKVITNLFLFHL